MGKKARVNEPLSDVIKELIDCSDELSQTKKENSALQRKLEKNRDTGDTDKNLLNMGLRLALENEALKKKNAELQKETAAGAGREEPATP